MILNFDPYCDKHSRTKLFVSDIMNEHMSVWQVEVQKLGAGYDELATTKHSRMHGL